MTLSDDERQAILEQLREEALRDCRDSGCTCEPRFSLTVKTYGPHDLPMWITEHDDDCRLATKVEEVSPGAETGLMIGESARRKLGL